MYLAGPHTSSGRFIRRNLVIIQEEVKIFCSVKGTTSDRINQIFDVLHSHDWTIWSDAWSRSKARGIVFSNIFLWTMIWHALWASSSFHYPTVVVACICCLDYTKPNTKGVPGECKYLKAASRLGCKSTAHIHTNTISNNNDICWGLHF